MQTSGEGVSVWQCGGGCEAVTEEATGERCVLRAACTSRGAQWVYSENTGELSLGTFAYSYLCPPITTHSACDLF